MRNTKERFKTCKKLTTKGTKEHKGKILNMQERFLPRGTRRNTKERFKTCKKDFYHKGHEGTRRKDLRNDELEGIIRF